MTPVYDPHSAAAQGLANCHTCGKLSASHLHHCPRCHSPLHLRIPHSLQYTWALLLTGALLYIPANILPVLQINQLGSSSSNTILGGVALLWEQGSYPVAIVIFIASVIIPLAKLFVLAWLCSSVQRHHQARPRERTRLYRLTELVGRWSMIDVFVVAILVALVQLGNLLAVQPGAAALAFGGVVIITMLAAMSFDPRLIWDKYGNQHPQ
ncbi:MAG: paraquat-inducible protein A [Chromatiales bacterium]|nr:paraquat-inducible protein A [Chromatiales bacterium]